MMLPQAGKQASRQAGKQASRQAGKQASRQVSAQAHRRPSPAVRNAAHRHARAARVSGTIR
ncbi:hypothetical protein C6P99_17745 [Burkholderia multivorans]|uniref:6-phosphofructokinase n=1 Tax=Burkholderia multivorans TaxID=87883 RepID=A0AB37AQI3_9BURK|nr:hypothetical protein C6P99_17745 [Burkholderia multivorans]